MTIGLFVPGWCLLSLFGLKSLSPALALPAAIGLGLSVVSVAAWLGWLSGTGMIGAAVLTLLATAGAIAARIVWRKRATRMERPGRLELGAAALAVVAIGLVLVTGPWLGQSADTFYHMAAARALLRENRALPQDVFFGVTMPVPDVTSGSLHLVLAWLSLVGGMNQAWVALAIFGAGFSALSFTAFAYALTRSVPAALIAAVVYYLIGLNLDMRDAGYPDRIGLDLAWLSIAFLLRFARTKPYQRRELVPMCLLGFAAGSVHPGMAPLLVVMALATITFSAMVALWRRNLRSVGPLAIACAAMVAVVLPVLAVRALAALPAPGPEASLAISEPRLPVLVIQGYALIDLRFWFYGFITITTLGTVCLLGRARHQLMKGDPAAALLWGGLLCVPAVAVTPFLSDWSIGLYFYNRVVFLLSPLLYVTLGWELSALLELPTKIRGRVRSRQTALQVVAALLLVAATINVFNDRLPSGALALYLGHGSRSMSTSRQNDLTQAWADRLRALDAAGPGTVLAGLETGYELAGLTGRLVVAVTGGHTPYEDGARDGALRAGDVADALNPSSDPTALLSVLFRYHVTFVMIDLARDGQATLDWIAGQKALTYVADGSGWQLYRFDSSRVDQALEIPLKQGVGLFPSRVIAGRAVFVRISSPGQGTTATVIARGISSGAVYESQFALPGQAGANTTAPLLLPDSARVDRYELTVSVPGSTPIVAGDIDVGHAYEAEYFAGVIVGTRRGFAREPGWSGFADPAYRRGWASASLRVGSVASHPLAEAPGDYCLLVMVSDGGDGGPHTLEVGLGGNVATAMWSGTSTGIREIEIPVRVGSASRQLTYVVPTGGAAGVIVDRITLYPTVSGVACGPGG